MTSPSRPARPPRTPEETLRAIAEQAAYDEAQAAKAEILAMSEAEVDAELRAEGLDPEAVAARGLAQIERLRVRRQEQSWQADAQEKLAQVRARFAAKTAVREKLPRAELRARIERARADARFTQAVTVMFRNKTAEQASDEELAELLEEIEMLAEMAGETKE